MNFETQKNAIHLKSIAGIAKQIFNVKELSLYTGLSPSCIYKLCQQGKIPHSKPNGKLIFFDKSKIDLWLLSNSVSPADDIERQATNYVIANPLNEEGWR